MHSWALFKIIFSVFTYRIFVTLENKYVYSTDWILNLKEDSYVRLIKNIYNPLI